jgi:hypothetical protein
MTRSKEAARIDAALASGDVRELEWAERYVRARIGISPTKLQEKHWQSVLRRLESAKGTKVG